jgi:hypothetical protein
MEENFIRQRPGLALQALASAVRRRVIDDNNFQIRHRAGANRLQNADDSFLLVKTRNYHGKFEGRWS